MHVLNMHWICSFFLSPFSCPSPQLLFPVKLQRKKEKQKKIKKKNKKQKDVQLNLIVGRAKYKHYGPSTSLRCGAYMLWTIQMPLSPSYWKQCQVLTRAALGERERAREKGRERERQQKPPVRYLCMPFLCTSQWSPIANRPVRKFLYLFISLFYLIYFCFCFWELYVWMVWHRDWLLWRFGGLLLRLDLRF